MTVRVFSRFSNKGSSSPRGENSRWFCDLHVSPEVEDSLTCGQVITQWDSQTRFTPKVRGPIEDYPWCMRSAPVVSDRLRRIIEVNAPGNAQFLPVRILYAGHAFEAGQPFWVANWLHLVGGTKTKSRPSDGSIGHYFDNLIQFETGDSSVHIFRWRDNPVVEFISQELRQIIADAAVTGVQYY